MKTWVLDASAVGAAIFEEEHGTRVEALMRTQARFVVPDLFFVEACNMIRKRFCRGHISKAEARELLLDVKNIGLELSATYSLAGHALDLALETNCSAYDCFYLALSIKVNGTVVSADRRFVNALKGGPFSERILWIGAL